MKHETMKIFHYLLIGALVLQLVIPDAEAGWFSRTFKKIGDGLKKAGNAAWKGIKKHGCKVLFGVVCPAAFVAGGAAVTALSNGTAAAAGATAMSAGTQACSVANKELCKRSVRDVNDTMDGMMMYPFSDEFSDYDLNQDKEIEYEEFAFAVMKQFPMGQPEELRVPFFWADANGDERLDMDEFVGAPFMFAHYVKGVAPVA